jgi:hypothetical protein
MLREISTHVFPVTIHFIRYTFDDAEPTVVKMSFRDVRNVARGITSEEEIFKSQGVEYRVFMDLLVANEVARKAKWRS